MPWMILARLLLGKILAGDDVKKKVIDELRKAAQRTDSTLDDGAVDVFEEAWDVVIPILIGKG